MKATCQRARTEFTRRTFLAGAAAALLTPGDLLHAQPRPRKGGPKVWRDLDQAALDAAYDQSKYAPNMAQIVARYATNSDAVRARIGAPERYAYGSSPIEALDVYRSRRPDAAVHIFIHGGAWRTGLAKDYAFPAEMFLDAGAHYVVPDFINVIDAKGSLLPMAAQVRRAVAWVHRNARVFGGDPDRIYLTGHSSGGHLAAVAMVTDWIRDFGLPSDTVKAGMCCSGLFDLAPVRRSARSAYVKITDEVEHTLSPQRHVTKLNAPLTVIYGTLETPEFQRQSQEFAEAVKAAGRSVQLLIGTGYNHFEVLETLGNPYGLLGRAILTQMNLLPG